MHHVFPYASSTYSTRIVAGRKSGFTLVELLVVIGIIALLISILLPALNKAREQANLVACGSNLRQAGMALQFYANDNKGYFPPTEYAYGTGQFVRIGSFAPGLSGPLYFLYKGGYVTDPRVWVCPAQPQWLELGWVRDSSNRWQPATYATANYQFRMWLMYRGGTALWPAPVPDYDANAIKPAKFRRMAFVVDRFGNSFLKLDGGPNHPSQVWNVLFTDGSVIARDMRSHDLMNLDLSWYEEGDALLTNAYAYPTHNRAKLWQWFDGIEP